MTHMTRSSSRSNVSGISLAEVEPGSGPVTEKKKRKVVLKVREAEVTMKKISTFQNPFDNAPNPQPQILIPDLSVAESIALDDCRAELKKAAYIPTNPTVLVNNPNSTVFDSPARSSKCPCLDSPLPIDPSLEPISPHDHSNIPKPSRFATPALPSGSSSNARALSETMSRPHFGNISRREGSVAPSSRALSIVPSALINGSGCFGMPLGISSTHSRPSKAAPGGSSLPEFHSLHLPVPTNPQARIPKALTDKIVVMEADIKKLTDEVHQAHAAIALR